MKRLEILKNSLVKKEKKFDDMMSNHFETVRQSNGQPLNDKRNGQATLNKWGKQDDALRSMKESIQKTKDAIDREESKLNYIAGTLSDLPKEIADKIDSGELKQWGKYPHIMFVEGVDKARMIWDKKKKQLSHKYVGHIKSKEQHKKFASIYNELNKSVNNYNS